MGLAQLDFLLLVIARKGEEYEFQVLHSQAIAWSDCRFEFLAGSFTMAQAHRSSSKPNILIIMGDDIGEFNISTYNMGMMGYKTPNIDSIAKEGAVFTDWYGQQSCTAGRAAFITGQSPIRPA